MEGAGWTEVAGEHSDFEAPKCVRLVAESISLMNKLAAASTGTLFEGL